MALREYTFLGECPQCHVIMQWAATWGDGAVPPNPYHPVCLIPSTGRPGGCRVPLVYLQITSEPVG